MKVFLSWSGPRSKAVGAVLKRRLPQIVQSIDIWMSSDDIPRGAGWYEAIRDAVTNSDRAIILVTPENQVAPWLTFEAGAFALAGERAVPWLIGMTDAELKSPMSNLNCVTVDLKDHVRQAVMDLDGHGFPERVGEMLDLFWDELSADLAAASIAPDGVEIPEPPPESDMVAEILSIVRGLQPSKPPRRRPGTGSISWSSAIKKAIGMDLVDNFGDVAWRVHELDETSAEVTVECPRSADSADVADWLSHRLLACGAKRVQYDHHLSEVPGRTEIMFRVEFPDV